MKAREFITEAWSQKYKSSINCSHPKGFSQRAHCAGKKKHNESREMEMVCEDCGMCQTHGNLNEIKKGAKDSNGYTRCWPGKHAEGTKTGKNGGQVRNCVPNESIEEAANAAQQAAIAINMKKHHQKPKSMSEDDDAVAAFVARGGEIQQLKPQRGPKRSGVSLASKHIGSGSGRGTTKGKVSGLGANTGKSGKPVVTAEQGVAEGICSLTEAHEIFDDFEQAMAARGLNEDAFDTITDEQIIRETAAWRRSAGKSKKGGLNRKGVASYRAEHPGSHLQMAVTTKPSKLKPGSKAAKRRKSFCARMSGVDGPMKKPNGKPTRKALALRKWNC